MAVKGVAVLGSATPPGRLRRVVEEAIGRAAATGTAELRLLDLAECEVGFAGSPPPGDDGPREREAALEAVAEAGIVILATPVYRGSMTGVLKNLLDLTPVEALRGKPVGLIAMGASDHHFLGAERHLRDVLAFFGAAVAPVAVFANSQQLVDGRASPELAAQVDALVARLAASVAVLEGLPPGPPPIGAPH
ncbi:MAG: NADPH-dependent FMN reductase [Solirubrobacterales bacterium]